MRLFETFEDIWHFVAAESEDAASRLIAALLEAGESLSAMPGRCQLVPELAGRGIRRLMFRTWSILFVIEGGATNHVEVVRIVHGGQSLGLLGLDH
jgi:plasmid stabilization system protein ParE